MVLVYLSVVIRWEAVGVDRMTMPTVVFANTVDVDEGVGIALDRSKGPIEQRQEPNKKKQTHVRVRETKDEQCAITCL